MLLPILALGMIAPQGTVNYDKGSYLLQSCKAMIRFMDSSTDRADASGDLSDGNYCRGYFAGLGAFMDTKASHVCLNQGNLLTGVRVYILFMDKHPKLNDEEAKAGAYLALLDAYPCPG